MKLVRLKQHQFITTRNGHTIDKYEEYEIIAKPHDKAQDIITDLNKWLKSKDDKSFYEWNEETKTQDGIGITGYGCWCEMIGDWLISTGWEYKGSDSWDKAEIWINNKGDK